MRRQRESGFSVTELLIVVAVMTVIAAFSVPNVINELKGYRLNADASALAGYANVARMKAAAQFAPYRLNINASNGTFNLEKLCGDTPSSVDANCSGGISPYASFTTPRVRLGTQYVSKGNTYSSCLPSGISVYPGDITANPSGCPSLLQIYFNTRGVPVNSAGGPLSNGGAAVYLTNPDGLVDAVTVSLGGRVAVWTWSPASAQWSMR